MHQKDLQLIGPLVQIGALPGAEANQCLREWQERGKKERLLTFAVKKGLLTRTQALVLADAPLERNQPFEKYNLLRKVGEGGMAVIYEATFKELEQRVALKILKTEFSLREPFRVRFQREAGIIEYLEHDNIVGGLEHDVVDGIAYCAMSFVDGISVLDLLDHHGRLDEGLALHIAAQVGEALEHMRERGVIHRDIKPDNFVVDPTGHVRIIDFGLALLAKGMSADTAESTTVGTVEYMSPEQCRGSDVDIRSDIYSLGVSLFQMITGELPFSGSQEEVMRGHVLEDLEFTTEQRNRIAPPVQFVLKKTMAKAAGDRYATPREMVDDLYAVAGDLIEARAEVPSIVEQAAAEEAPIAPPPSRSAPRTSAPRPSAPRSGRSAPKSGRERRSRRRR